MREKTSFFTYLGHKKRTMKKIILTYGSIAGLIVGAFLCIGFGTELGNMETGQILGFAVMILAFALIFVGIKKHRDRDLDGEIKFSTAFLLGLGITAVATVIYVISWMIVSETIAVDFMKDYTNMAIEKIRASDLSIEEQETEIKDLRYWEEAYKNPLIKIAFTVIEIFPVGLIISLISTLVLKKKK